MYKCESLKHFYELVGKDLLEKGDAVSPRGYETKELLNVSFMIENPRARLVYNPDRNFSLIYALVESLMLIQNTKKLKYFSKFNKNAEAFSDDGITLSGAYGPRVVKSLKEVVEKLKADPGTRQAVCPILRVKDILKDTKDVPCTMGLHFMVRNGKLNLHTYMRSNDIMWGTTYDIFMFTILQELVANELQMEVGAYYHNTSSLHVYKDFKGFMGCEALEKMLSGSQSFEFSIPYGLDEWQELGRWYVAKVDNKRLDYSCSAGELINHTNPIVKLLTNEFDFKRSGQGNLFDISDLEWAEPFCKRWYKHG